MGERLIWTTPVLEEFIRLGNLTEDEEWVLRTRAKKWPRTKQAMERGFSLATLDRIIHRIKEKYDAVQPYSKILKPRTENSVTEKWMDEN